MPVQLQVVFAAEHLFTGFTGGARDCLWFSKFRSNLKEEDTCEEEVGVDVA